MLAKGNSYPLKQQQQELVWLAFIVFAGVISRLIFILVFPAQPVSDFLRILNFARTFSHDIFATNSPMWESLNPGVSFFLAPFLHLYPASPEFVARTLTAILTGLLPIIPFQVWKGVFSLRTRVITALFLALYPAQIIFSGVVAQDNWVLLPTAALGALAVRVITLKSPGHPVWAAVLYVAGMMMRQEMLVAFLPVYLVVTLGYEKRHYIANVVWGFGITALLLGLLVIQRGIATGRFSLTTAHMSGSILGAYAPGAEMSWLDPKILVAARAPELFENERYKEHTFDLLLNELLFRPGYHAIRILSSPFFHLMNMEFEGAYWGLTAPGVLTGERLRWANYFLDHFLDGMRYFSYLIHVLFLGTIILAIVERKLPSILPLLGTIILKLGVHALIVSQSRYYFVVYVLEVLTIGMLFEDLLTRLYAITDFFNRKNRNFCVLRNTYVYLMLGGALGIGISQMANYAHNLVIKADENTQVIYQFPASTPGAEIWCEVTEGRLLHFQQGKASSPSRIMIDFQQADPAPGSQVLLTCVASPNTGQSLTLRIQDRYPTGNYPGRIIQIVTINGEEVYRHDIAAEPGAGWHNIPLDGYPDGTPLDIQITLLAQNPDTGWQWGRAAITEVQFEEAQSPP